MTPRAPLANCRLATAASSTAIRLWAKVAVWAVIERTGPMNHVSRSTLWIAWFISAPPPSSFQLPRQAPLS